MPDDPMAVIATSYRALVDGHRLALRLQAFALAVLGLSLVGQGLLVWLTVSAQQEHAAMIQALTVQTQALVQRLKTP